MRTSENTFITLSDGRRLSARIWMPDGADRHPVPAILEYLPYRKRDGTAPRDESTYPVFAAAGYAGVRVDISGTGESDGDFDDEYSPRELSDGEEVIAWIAAQPWCTGAVGMMGISWGGFNSLQIAALDPPALKAVIAIGTTVDRYNDDVHCKNGCLLYSNFWWSSVMLCYASRPPDPALVGQTWRDLWMHRLNTQPLEILGRPVVRLRAAIGKPVGHLAVRLVDVHADGTGSRVSWGVINLSHRNGNAAPEAMRRGQLVDLELAMDECGYRFLAGHILRVSISTAYWPMIMPPPEIVTATITLGEGNCITLPVREGGDEYPLPEPVDHEPLPVYTQHSPARCERRVERDLQHHHTRYVVVDDSGEDEMPGHGLRTRHLHQTRYDIALDDPLAARARSLHTCWMSRGEWSIRTESESQWWCDATHFHVQAEVRAFEDEQLMNERSWQRSIPRDLM